MYVHAVSVAVYAQKGRDGGGGGKGYCAVFAPRIRVQPQTTSREFVARIYICISRVSYMGDDGTLHSVCLCIYTYALPACVHSGVLFMALGDATASIVFRNVH